MHAVEEAVVDFHRHPQRFAAGAVRHVLPPRDARDVVVPVKIPLVGQGRQVQPRDAGKIDEGVQLLVVLVEEVGLRLAACLGGGAELLHRLLLRQGDDVKILAAGFQVGEAGDALVQQENLAAPDGITEVLHGIDGVRSQIDQRIVKRKAMPLGVGVEPGHIHPEGGAVKGLGHRREKAELFRAGPVGRVDLLHGNLPFS